MTSLLPCGTARGDFPTSILHYANLPTVTTQFFVGVPVKRQQPISVVMEILHKIVLPDLTFPSDLCVDVLSKFKINKSNCIV